MVDASNPQAEMQMHIVYETLKELGALGKRRSHFLTSRTVFPGRAPGSPADHTLKISARTGEGLEEFKTSF